MSDAEKDEVEAISSSADAIDRYVDAAIGSFNKMLKHVVHLENKEEWDGWDSGMKVRAAMYREELQEVQKDAKQVKAGLGADLSAEPHVSQIQKNQRDQGSRLHTLARRLPLKSMASRARSRLSTRAPLMKSLNTQSLPSASYEAKDLACLSSTSLTTSPPTPQT